MVSNLSTPDINVKLEERNSNGGSHEEKPFKFDLIQDNVKMLDEESMKTSRE
jgi:hypothetical protein